MKNPKKSTPRVIIIIKLLKMKMSLKKKEKKENENVLQEIREQGHLAASAGRACDS